jgi:tetratricopeptide (TPR) repeat protein
VEAAREASEQNPADPRPWLLRARAERTLGLASAEAGDGTTAELRLLDARSSTERAVALAPADPEAWRERGRALRDSSHFPGAAEAFRKALAAAGSPDGETLYDLGFCLAYAGDFAGGLEAFAGAGRLLPGDPRVAVNAAICEERLGDRKAAVARLSAHYDAECAAGQAGGEAARRDLEKTWELTVMRQDPDAGVAAFRSILESHPGRTEPGYMLGNLLAFLGRHAEAAAAYARSLEAGETPGARVRLARELAAIGPGRRAEADAAARAALARHPGAPELPAVLLRAVRLHLDAGEPKAALSLLAEAGPLFPRDADLALAGGDAALASGDAAAAAEAYGRAKGLDPFATAPAARAERAALAALRASREGSPDAARFDAPGTPLDPSPPREVLLDFEEPGLVVRPLWGTRVQAGGLRFPPAGPGASRRVYLHFFPDLDGTRWTHVDVTLALSSGEALLRAELADGMDQMSEMPSGRLRWPPGRGTVPLGAEARTVEVPLRAFEGVDPVRTVPADLPRLKCLVLDVAGPEPGPAPTVILEGAALRDARDGRTLPLLDLEEGLREVTVLFEGTCTPFTRLIGSKEVAEDVLPTGTTAVSKAILEDQNGTFDPSMVGSGAGSVRVRHGDSAFFPSRRWAGENPAFALPDGPASATVRLSPDRDVQRFRGISFLARGEKGGERLRLRIQDRAGLDLEPRVPASAWPRSLFPRTGGEDGALALSREWRKYVLPLDRYPEVDRGALAALVFELGSEVGNAPGATVFLDEIGME